MLYHSLASNDEYVVQRCDCVQITFEMIKYKLKSLSRLGFGVSGTGPSRLGSLALLLSESLCEFSPDVLIICLSKSFLIPLSIIIDRSRKFCL